VTFPPIKHHNCYLCKQLLPDNADGDLKRVAFVDIRKVSTPMSQRIIALDRQDEGSGGLALAIAATNFDPLRLTHPLTAAQ
jgi:hypothetical protein